MNFRRLTSCSLPEAQDHTTSRHARRALADESGNVSNGLNSDKAARPRLVGFTLNNGLQSGVRSLSGSAAQAKRGPSKWLWQVKR